MHVKRGQPTTGHEMKAGYCAVNYIETDRYNERQCGPIRATYEEARKDAKSGRYQGIRYVHTDGYLYVEKQDENQQQQNTK